MKLADTMLRGWLRLPPRARDTILRAVKAANAALYRRTGGRVGGRVGKVPVLLLTTTGRRSGRPKTTPLFYLEDDGRAVVVASNGGDDRTPAWLHNLIAAPEVAIQVGRQITPVRGRVAEREEKARLWPLLVEMYPQYALYQRMTSRDIPVVILGSTAPSGASLAMKRHMA